MTDRLVLHVFFPVVMMAVALSATTWAGLAAGNRPRGRVHGALPPGGSVTIRCQRCPATHEIVPAADMRLRAESLLAEFAALGWHVERRLCPGCAK